MLVKLYQRTCQSSNYKIRDNDCRPRACLCSSISQQRNNEIPWSKQYISVIIDTANRRFHALPWGLFCSVLVNLTSGNIEIHPFLSLDKSMVALSFYLRFFFKKSQFLHWQWWNFWSIDWTWNLVWSIHRVKKKITKVHKKISRYYLLSLLFKTVIPSPK